MANEKRLIDANALRKKAIWGKIRQGTVYESDAKVVTTGTIDTAPTVDAVSRGVVDQIRWERDVAIKQLEEHGIPFGGIAPDVVKVVRCKDCKYWGYVVGCGHYCECIANQMADTVEDDFCSYGERKDNGV